MLGTFGRILSSIGRKVVPKVISGADEAAEGVARAVKQPIRRRVWFKDKGSATGPRGISIPKAVAGPIVALTGLSALNRNFYTDEDTGPQLTAEQINRALDLGGEGQADLDKFLAASRGNIEGLYDTSDMRAQAERNLNNYLAQMNQYAQGQGGAISKAYEDLAALARARGEQSMAQSQMAATDIDRLYGAAAAEQAALAGGRGMAVPPSEVSGLTGVSGMAAETPDVSRTYGQSLADWMGRQGIINREDLESAAQSYMAQGIGSRAQLEAEAQGLGSRARYDLQQQLIEADRQAQLQREQALFALEQQRQEADLEQSIEDRALRRQAGLLALQAPQLWESIEDNDPARKMWKSLGVTDAQSLYNALTTRPELAQLVSVE